MLYYLAHVYQGKKENMERAKRIARRLQMEHPEHCIVCPILNFSHLKYGEMGYRAEMDLCLDLLSACDVLIVASEPSKGVQEEIEFAHKVGMEVRYLA